MRVILQRVTSASVAIDNQIVGRIERGLLVFVGIEESDDASDGQWLADKIARLRIFSDADGQMNLSVRDISGGILLISQFTLHASTQKGTRPSFNRAARAFHAEPLYERLIVQLSAALERPVATGKFGADMQVSLTNDGPVTLSIDSKQRE
jgi:D-tyrosyl-tRNA(Tyr) deacylase